MDNALRDRLDASFGDGPDHRPLEEPVREGRRVVRLRRLALVGGTLAVLTAVGLGAAFIPAGTQQPDVASDPSSAAVPTSEPPEIALTAAMPVDDSWRSSCGTPGHRSCAVNSYRQSHVYYLDDGTLARVSKDVTILQRVDNPVAVPGGRSVAIESKFDGTVAWWFLTWAADGTEGGGVHRPGGKAIDFESWVAELATPERLSFPLDPLPRY